MCGDRKPLGRIGIEEFGRCARHHRGQFPAEVIGILNARIQALPGGR